MLRKKEKCIYENEAACWLGGGKSINEWKDSGGIVKFILWLHIFPSVAVVAVTIEETGVYIDRQAKMKTDMGTETD